MNILKKLSKDSSGFGHIEMIVIVLVVAAIAGVGFFVYQNHSKSGKHSTAHAGGWSQLEWYVGGNSRFTLEACFTPIQAFGTTINQVRVGVINNSGTNIDGYLGVVDYSQNLGNKQSQWADLHINSQPWGFFPVINMVPAHDDEVAITYYNSNLGFWFPINTDPHFGNPTFIPGIDNNGKITNAGSRTNLSRC